MILLQKFFANDFNKIEINDEWSVNFLQTTRCVQKVSRRKLFLLNQKWKMNKALILFEIVHTWHFLD